MVDQYARMLSGAKGFMMLKLHGRSVWCQINAVRFNESVLSVLETIAQHVLNEDLDIQGSAEVVGAARKYVSASNKIQEHRIRVV